MDLLRGKTDATSKRVSDKKEKKRGFLWEFAMQTVSSKKSLPFFVAFACFCFSAMVQMGIAMKELSPGAMGWIILLIGVVLAVTTMLMAITSILRNSSKTVSLMKAFGYTAPEYTGTILGGYMPFSCLGFLIGTVYQYGLLKFMTELVFRNVADMPVYHFDFTALWITLGIFIVCYIMIFVICLSILRRTALQAIMSEI